jgi:uncharacterized membrane protein HdeD (DUF308 family)
MTTHTWYSETAPRSLRRSLGENWLLFLLRGLAAILFGALSLVWPGLSLLTLILLYAAYAVVDGVFALVAGIFGTGSAAPRWWLIIVGLLGIAAGIVTFLWPGITALVLLFFIAGWAICTGLLQIIGAIQLRKEIEDEWWLILDGLLSVVVGIAMFVLPGAGALALIWLIGLYAIMAGVLMVGFAFTVRRYKDAAA